MSDNAVLLISAVWPTEIAERSIYLFERTFGEQADKVVLLCAPLAAVCEMSPSGFCEYATAVIKVAGLDINKGHAILFLRQALMSLLHKKQEDDDG